MWNKSVHITTNRYIVGWITNKIMWPSILLAEPWRLELKECYCGIRERNCFIEESVDIIFVNNINEIQ